MQNFYLQTYRTQNQKTEAVTLSKEYLKPLSLSMYDSFFYLSINRLTG